MFDTHAHLNFKALQDEVEDIIARSKEAGVHTITVPGTDNKSSVRAVEIAQQNEGIYAAVGIHPHHVFEEIKRFGLTIDYIKRLSVIISLLTKAKVVAVGEVGLDRHIYKNTKYSNYQINEEFMMVQKEFFSRQIRLALEFQKSLIIHNRETEDEILEILEAKWDPFFTKRVVIHCCEPSRKILLFAIKKKVFIGIDGDITYNPIKQMFIKYVPPELLVLETDSPFLLPEPLRSEKKFPPGRALWAAPNTPANLPLIAQFVADIRGEKLEELAKQTTENARTLFSIS